MKWKFAGFAAMATAAAIAFSLYPDVRRYMRARSM
jgi:hypothetical protein